MLTSAVPGSATSPLPADQAPLKTASVNGWVQPLPGTQSIGQCFASASQRAVARIGCRLAAHCAETDIACETVCHIDQRGHAGRAGLPLALRANAPASPPNIAAFRMPATSHWSASTAWSPLPNSRNADSPLARLTPGHAARASIQQRGHAGYSIAALRLPWTSCWPVRAACWPRAET